MTDAAREQEIENRAKDYHGQLGVDVDYLLGVLRATRAERDQLQRLGGFAEADVDAAALKAADNTWEQANALLEVERARVGALREALAPFAAPGKFIDESRPEKQQAFLSSSITVGDLRRARSVLEEMP